MKISSKIKDKIKSYFLKKPEVAAIYLYGSQADGSARADSDIDLAALVTDKSKYTGFGIFQVVFAQELTDLLGKEVEVQDLDACSVDFAHRVLSKGKLILSNDEAGRVSFEERTIRNYFDMKPFIEEYYRLNPRAKTS